MITKALLLLLFHTAATMAQTLFPPTPVTTTVSDSPSYCFEAGECTNSLFLETWETPDPQRCLELCREFGGCEYFTHHADEELCLAFANCEVFDTGCADEGGDCLTGTPACDGNRLVTILTGWTSICFSDLVCWEPGQCQGDDEVVVIAEQYFDCLDRCKEDDDCQWFNYQESDQACVLLLNCESVDDFSCDSCTYSQKECAERQREDE